MHKHKKQSITLVFYTVVQFIAICFCLLVFPMVNINIDESSNLKKVPCTLIQKIGDTFDGKNLVLVVGGKTQTGTNPCSQWQIKKPIHMHGSGLRWDSNGGPQRWKEGQETTKPISQPECMSEYLVAFEGLTANFTGRTCSRFVWHSLSG